MKRNHKNPFLGRSVDEDLRRDMKNPKFARTFHKARTDLQLRYNLRALAEKTGVGVRELARRMGTHPAQVERLFTRPLERCQVDTLVRFGTALGREVTISFKKLPSAHP